MVAYSPTGFAVAIRRTVGLVVVGLVLAAPGPARAQSLSVDGLLAKVFEESKDVYELSADFSGTLTLTVRGSKITMAAAGTFLEFRRPGEHVRRKVTITALDVPLLLRPFTGTLRKLITDKIETQAENSDAFLAHDIYLAQDLGGRRFLLVGVHRAIIDDILNRYGKPQDLKDPATRRKVAQWLYTTPSVRNQLVRPGPPYAMRAVIDDDGNVYEVTLLYDWGEVGTKISYIFLSGSPLWRQVTADSISETAVLGRVDGVLQLTFSNHCLNCKHP